MAAYAGAFYQHVFHHLNLWRRPSTRPPQQPRVQHNGLGYHNRVRGFRLHRGAVKRRGDGQGDVPHNCGLGYVHCRSSAVDLSAVGLA